MNSLREDCPILPSGPGADEIGWSIDRFTPDSYLWLKDSELWVSLVVARSPGKGHFAEFVKRAEGAGYRLIVPTPSARMTSILQKQGFERQERQTDMGACEIWVRPD